MMQNRSKRILAMLLSVWLMFSTVFVSSAEGSVIHLDKDVSSSDVSGSDVIYDVSVSDGIPDVTEPDVSGSDVSDPDVLIPDVSSSDVSGSDLMPTEMSNSVFRVTDGRGDEFGAYGSWDELLAEFKTLGNTAENYTIVIAGEGVIGKELPSKASKLTLKPADGDVLQFEAGTVNLTTALEISSATLWTAGGDHSVNFNTKGKTLTLRDVLNLGTVKGTSAGALYLAGDVEIQGVLQTFKYVTVDGSLRLGNNMTSITNLNIESGTVCLTAGRNFTVTNVAAGEQGTLVYPDGSSFPIVKISGTVTGVLSLRQYAEVDGESAERYFTAGSKLLTAAKAKAEQFAIYGEGQLCYKKGSVIYAGAEVLQLYAGDELLGIYAQWSDLVAKINSVNQKNAVYRIALLDDFTVTGALTMPAKGKYAGIAIENGTESQVVSLQATGNVTLTANLDLGKAVHVSAATVSGASWQLRMEEDTVIVTTGAVTVNRLIMGQRTVLQSGGKFTVKNLLEADNSAELILTQKKGAAIKDTQVEDGSYITVKVRDASDRCVTLAQGTNLFTVSGSSYATQFCLLDAEDQPVELYRKGNAIKVRGSIETPIILYYVTEDGEISLGEYAALADIKTEIARRKDKTASYRLAVEKEIFVKGAIPLPGANTYREIIFSGEQIRTTGNITLTGNVTFTNKVSKIKSQTDDTKLALAVNLSKYKLTIPEGAAIEKLGSVTGGTGSGLDIASGVPQSITGNLKAESLWLNGTLQVSGSITLTNIYPGEENQLAYDLAKSFTIKGNILGDGAKLMLSPMKSGQEVKEYTEGMKIISNAAKVDVSRLKLTRPTEYEFYRDKTVVKLGMSMITVFAGTLDYENCLDAETEGQQSFVRINDVIAYINDSEHKDFVVRLDKDVPSAGAFSTPAKGKQVLLCGREGERRILKLSGSITLDGCGLIIRNIKLDNATSAGTGIVLKNGASLWLCDTEINTLSAPAGTAVTLEGQVTMKGAMSGSGDLTVWKNTVLRGSGNLVVGTLTLQKEQDVKGSAEFRLLSGKRLTVNGAVNSDARGHFTVIQVDKTDAPARISEGTILVISQYGEASQFRTENIKPDTLSEWGLTKVDNYIKTTTPSEGVGEWSIDYL